jgi:hypothetical protein
MEFNFAESPATTNCSNARIYAFFWNTCLVLWTIAVCQAFI